MPTELSYRAARGRSVLVPNGRIFDRAPVAVALLLSVLFAAAISAALQPPRPVAEAQSAFQGGL